MAVENGSFLGPVPREATRFHQLAQILERLDRADQDLRLGEKVVTLGSMGLEK
jgi:hypothetical protein